MLLLSAIAIFDFIIFFLEERLSRKIKLSCYYFFNELQHQILYNADVGF